MPSMPAGKKPRRSSRNNRQEASEILLQLNRDHPGTPAILKRLVLVFEQLRDPGKAAAFLRAYLKEDPGDSWAVPKRHEFASIG